MEKQRGIRTLSIVALFVAVIGLSVAFAAMSRTLQINGTATIATAKWDIHFENLVGPGVDGAEAKGTGAATVEKAPSISDSANGESTVIGDYKVTLTKPGDSVTYNFKVTNEGTINAKIGTFTKTAPVCNPATDVKDGDATATEEDAALVCGNLTYTLTYKDTGAAVAADDTLAAGETKDLVLKLIYNDEATTLPTANTDVEITGLDITMVYVQD